MLQHQAADDLTLIIKEKNHSPLKKKKNAYMESDSKYFANVFNRCK